MKCDIITPTYNRPNFLKRAIKSVLNQTSPNWELWICDDGSDYDIETIVKGFENERIHFIQHSKLTEKERLNHSSSIPRNAVLKASCNEIIAYLDDDNFLWPGAIEGALRYFAQHPDHDAIGCRLTYSDKYTAELPKEKRKSRMFDYGRLDAGQMVHRRKCLDWTFQLWRAYWPPGAKICNDWHFFVRMKAKYPFYPLDIFFLDKYKHPFAHQELSNQGKGGTSRRE